MNKQLVVKIINNLFVICPIKKLQIFNDDITIIVEKSLLFKILLFLKYNIFYQFKILTCISAVDYPTFLYRFNIVYELLSVRFNQRIKIKIFINEHSSVYSCEKLFAVANWYEREIWDMFGIFFKNHSNLKKILTDYGFEGYPLRKDFPLTGFIEIKYNEIEKRVLGEIIETSQEYRIFDYLSPWQLLKN